MTREQPTGRPVTGDDTTPDRVPADHPQPGAGPTVPAVRWHGVGDVRLEMIAAPSPPGPGEVLLRVLACGICGTDVEKLRHGAEAVPAVRDPVSGALVATVIGHEFAGVVEAVGPGVTSPAVGTLVSADTLLPCGHCTPCRRGRPNLCEQLRIMGLSADGGMTPSCVVPARTLLPVPAGVTADEAVLAETLAVAVRAVRQADGTAAPDITGPPDTVGNRDTAVTAETAHTPDTAGEIGGGSATAGVAGRDVTVVGGGAVGLLTAQVARAFGARTVTVVEPRADRRELARRLGADAAVGPAEVTARSADVVLECTGAPAAVATALDLARTGGTVVVVGVHSGSIPFALNEVVSRELTVRGSFSHRIDTDLADALVLLGSGQVRAEPLIGLRIGLDEAVGVGFPAAAAGEVVKVVVHPSAD